MTSNPTVIIVDDDLAIRESLSELIKAMGLHVVSYETAHDFLVGYDGSNPGCLLLDLRLPGMSGMALFEHLVEQKVPLPVIFITGYGDIPTSVKAMRLGALDFLEKPCKTDLLKKQIKRAIELDTKNREETKRKAEVNARIALLTPDEYEVMQRIVAGQINKNIAAELRVSIRTVQFRRSAIMKKMNVTSRASLMAQVLSVR